MELKRISRDFKTPVIGISSFNRQNYREAVSMEAFKESGAIEYSSDVLIGLQLAGAGMKDFDTETAKSREPRQIELKILKSRNGPTGGIVEFDYHPKFNYFEETHELPDIPIKPRAGKAKKGRKAEPEAEELESIPVPGVSDMVEIRRKGAKG